MKYLKGMFTCENKKDINGRLEYEKEILEEIHKNMTCTILNVKYKFLTIGLLQVDYQYYLKNVEVE